MPKEFSVNSKVLEIFKQHGFKMEGTRVFITENDLNTALETAPSRFTLRARNPAHNVAIGEDDFVFLPTGGAPTAAMPTATAPTDGISAVAVRP